eukprot:3383922-Rhodomonas_salina.2
MHYASTGHFFASAGHGYGSTGHGLAYPRGTRVFSTTMWLSMLSSTLRICCHVIVRYGTLSHTLSHVIVYVMTRYRPCCRRSCAMSERCD